MSEVKIPEVTQRLADLRTKDGTCFYCKQPVGKPHKGECPHIIKIVRYEVLSDEVLVGYYDSDDMYSWTRDNGEFHKNESSWCSDNALEAIHWLSTAFAQQVRVELLGADLSPDDDEELDDEIEPCSCNFLAFRYHQTINPGPLVRE